MKLFDETENKYYEFVARLLQNGKSFNKKELYRLIENRLSGEPDFDVIDTIFADKEGEEILFSYSDDEYTPIIPIDFPIRNGVVEQHAAKSLLEDEYIAHFLAEETISKLEKATYHVNREWTVKDINRKNIFSFGAKESKKQYEYAISIIARAIRESKAIQYDNIRPNVFEYRGESVFPVKIEFSIVNDQFRVCAYDKKQDRFIKMNMETLENITLLDDVTNENLSVEYEEYLKNNTKTLVLDVEPVSHVIERCFRIFSYFDRNARYDREENKYRLEISYLNADEGEIVKDVLSLGGYVTVIEPKQLQKKVYKRIVAARDRYA
ncbi:WYL domain-containing protein [Lachnospiraceae bacterium LCP25S3_G4]